MQTLNLLTLYDVKCFTQLFTRSRAARDMMQYYWETMDACVPPASVLTALSDAGLVQVQRTTSLGLFSEYSAHKL